MKKILVSLFIFILLFSSFGLALQPGEQTGESPVVKSFWSNFFSIFQTYSMYGTNRQCDTTYSENPPTWGLVTPSNNGEIVTCPGLLNVYISQGDSYLRLFELGRTRPFPTTWTVQVPNGLQYVWECYNCPYAPCRNDADCAEGTDGHRFGNKCNLVYGTENFGTNVPIGNCYNINCVENWQCGSWTSCINGWQTRECDDLNECGTANNKPVAGQSCTVTTTTTTLTTTTTTIPIGQPYIEDVNNCKESEEGVCVEYNAKTTEVTGTFVIKNTGEDMTKDWIIEMQVVPKSKYEFFPMSIFNLGVSDLQETCDINRPENVHKTFRLKKGQEATVVLKSKPRDPTVDSKVWVIIETACYKDDGVLKLNNEWISDYKDGGDVGTIDISEEEEEEEEEEVFEKSYPLTQSQWNKATSKQILKAMCETSQECDEREDYEVECIHTEDIEKSNKKAWEERGGVGGTIYSALCKSWTITSALNWASGLCGVWGSVQDIPDGTCRASKGIDLTWFTDDTLIDGVPNIAILGGILVLLFVIFGRRKT